jgi:serine/threonine protein kinase
MADAQHGFTYTQIQLPFHDALIGFAVPSRYEFGNLLSSGTFGVVACVRSCTACLPSLTDGCRRARDVSTGTDVAIKKIVGSFRHTEIAQRTYREFRILSSLGHPNVRAGIEAYPCRTCSCWRRLLPCWAAIWTMTCTYPVSSHSTRMSSPAGCSF